MIPGEVQARIEAIRDDPTSGATALAVINGIRRCDHSCESGSAPPRRETPPGAALY
jgi:hypothetical protein